MIHVISNGSIRDSEMKNCRILFQRLFVIGSWLVSTTSFYRLGSTNLTGQLPLTKILFMKSERTLKKMIVALLEESCKTRTPTDRLKLPGC